jgi:hypothetical protein
MLVAEVLEIKDGKIVFSRVYHGWVSRFETTNSIKKALLKRRAFLCG